MMVSVLSVLIVVMMFLFWRATWFGRQLSDSEIGEYLADEERPRRAQHALARISDRLNGGDRSVTRWYPAVIALADHPLAQLRVNVAWLMGQDNGEQAFHEQLRQMLADQDPLVRRNAALSLIRFGDNAGHAELRAMLEDYTVLSPHQGVLTNRLVEGDVVAAGTLLARVEAEGEDEDLEVRSPVPGVVEERLLEDGAEITAGRRGDAARSRRLARFRSLARPLLDRDHGGHRSRTAVLSTTGEHVGERRQTGPTHGRSDS